MGMDAEALEDFNKALLIDPTSKEAMDGKSKLSGAGGTH
jgi:hypothetical protein